MTPYELIRDALGVIGVSLVGAGLWQIHPAAAQVAAGLLLFTVALVVMRRR